MSVPTDILLSFVEAKPVMAGTVGAVGASLVLGLPTAEAVLFAGTVALGVSLGDALLTGAGFETKIGSYLDGAFAAYFDPMDFVGGAVGVALINLSLGISGRNLAVMSGMAAVAGGVAPKLSAMILSKLTFETMTPAKTGSKGVAGESLRG